MGLQYRKRVGRKNAWFNIFASGKGVGGSYSFKLGKNVTCNIGNGRRRVTYNFGNGFRWVQNRTVKKAKSVIASIPKTVKHSYALPEYKIIDPLVIMRRYMHGKTAEEYVEWYNALSEIDKTIEDNRINKIYDDLKAKNEKAERKQREYEEQLRRESHVPIWQFILYAGWSIIFNPFILFLVFCFWFVHWIQP